jgi:hypothetical protein
MAILAVGLLTVPFRASAGGNLLQNGDFAVGSGDSVDEWRSDAWILTAGTTDYVWMRPQAGHGGEVEVDTHRDNDARWVQQVSLTPGWYYISAEARTVGVQRTFTGANVAVLEDGISSVDLRNDSDWRRLGFYLKIGPQGADVDVALRLGGYMNLTRGRAFFRDARVEQVSGLPAGADRVFDLDEIRKEEVTGPVGHTWTLVVTLIALVLLASVGWRMLDASGMAPAATADRAKRWRRKRSSHQNG